MKSLFITLVLLLFFSCNSRQKEEVKNETAEKLNIVAIKEDFVPVLNNFIDLLRGGSETNIIVVICYRVFDNDCILVANDFGYNPEFLRGYTEYKDYLICYYGVDDCVAEKIFYNDNLDKNTPADKYVNKDDIKELHAIMFDPIGGYYLIDDLNNITPYEPSPKIRQELTRLAIQHGFIRATPPEP